LRPFQTFPHSVDEQDWSSPEVASTPPPVKLRPERGEPSAARRFTPHLALISRLHETPYSDRGVRLLTLFLWAARRVGQGQGCRPHEAMLWRREADLTAAMGIRPGCKPGRSNRSGLHRAKRELAGELDAPAVLRWRVVRLWQRLPDPEGTGDEFTGATARYGASCVYFVDVGALWTMVGRPDLARGPVRADGFNHGSIDGTKTPPPPREKLSAFAGPAGPPVKRSPPVNHMVSFNKPQQGNATHPPPVVVVNEEGLESEARAVFDRWWALLGEPRGAAPHICQAFAQAVRAAVASGVPTADLLDAIEGRADPKLGGAAYTWCEERRIWHAPLIWNADRGRVSGCLDKLVEHVRASRAALERRRQRATQERAARETVESDRVDPAEMRAFVEALCRPSTTTPPPPHAVDDPGQPGGGDKSG
jgi:hypothetical protein